MEVKKITDDYFIDSDGNVYSRPRFKTRGGILKHRMVGPRGMQYLAVKMTINNKKCTQKIHRLLATAFIPNPNNYTQINHKDGNKLNNKLDNLEWCTPSQNIKHAWDTGLQSKKSSSGMRYIYIDKQNRKFRVIICRPNKKIRLGRFLTLQQAISTRDKWLQEDILKAPRPTERCYEGVPL